MQLRREIAERDQKSAGRHLPAGIGSAGPHGGAASASRGQTQQARALIDAKAWTDAALAIADLDRSRAIQYLVYEDGEWRCGIGSHRALPHWLGESAAFGHPVLALAILGALIDTLGWTEEANVSPAPAPQSCSGDSGAMPAVSCDNYT